MIVTYEWLKEWIDLDGINTDKICKSLNAIGLEVDSVDKIRIPKGVKVGFVKLCEKHPNADKLSVCQVDLGSEVTQIVCGAKNVAKGQFVAVATVGTVLSEDFKIKEAKLRGVESLGMICGSTEIGLPLMNDGVIVLDDSIGRLELGKELSSYELLNDDVIDIELTANRGDCLSIYGVSRDLCASLNKDMKDFKHNFDEDNRGVARVLKLDVQNGVQSEVLYRFFEIKKIELPFLYAFRLACIENISEDPLLDYLSYATHSTGVLFRAYDFSKLVTKELDEVTLSLKQDSLGFDAIYSNDKLLSVVGINENDEFKVKDSAYAVVEANYIDPDLISHKKSLNDIKTDEQFYRSSRGSYRDLKFGFEYLNWKIKEKNEISIYAGVQGYKLASEPRIVKLEHSFINSFIGQEILSEEVSQILERLGFKVKRVDELFIITVPIFRHDISNREDIIEELVRIIGIDNIKSKALNFSESMRLNEAYVSYKKRNHFRYKAASIGFFESIHYFFDNLSLVQKYDLEVVKKELDLTNPITNELNTLRTTLIMNLLNSCSKNIKFGKKSVKLFEIGSVVDQNRQESKKLSFVFSGEREAYGVKNRAKPKNIDFFEFTKLISMVIGDIKLLESEDVSKIVSPYEYARVISCDKDIGYIARVHVKLEKELDLLPTYICELDFDGLKYENITASPYSKFPALSRDLSLIVPKNLKFSAIRAYLDKVVPKEVVSYAPIDVYESSELGDNLSVTVKFELQSMDKTLQEEQIVKIMDEILLGLKEELGIGIR